MSIAGVKKQTTVHKKCGRGTHNSYITMSSITDNEVSYKILWYCIQIDKVPFGKKETENVHMIWLC